MRKLIVSNIMSVDGYVEGPDKNVMGLFDYRRELYPQDESFDRYNAERLRAADTLLLGRTTFMGFRSFWPAMADNPAAPPISREISRLNNAIDKVVVSDTLTQDATAPWHNTRIVRRGDAHAAIAALKQQPGREILVFGSSTLWNDLLEHGLVDELHLLIGPVALAAGTPVFSRPPEAALRLAGPPRTWDGSGNVLVRYTVHPQTA